MAETKTKPTDVSVDAFLAAVENPTRRADGQVLLEMMREITGEAPRMWGPTLVGFGQRTYKYESGHGGITLRTGFSPRKASLVLYVLAFDKESQAAILSRLGKHKRGVGCLYINKLADVDLDVLRQLIADSWTRSNLAG